LHERTRARVAERDRDGADLAFVEDAVVIARHDVVRHGDLRDLCVVAGREALLDADVRAAVLRRTFGAGARAASREGVEEDLEVLLVRRERRREQGVARFEKRDRPA
jgi:hypothetical protein